MATKTKQPKPAARIYELTVQLLETPITNDYVWNKDAGDLPDENVSFLSDVKELIEDCDTYRLISVKHRSKVLRGF